jgi:Rrf2 family nitric oxide-sensitive transcriptional repressor
MLCTIDEIATAYNISTNHLTKVAHQELETVRGQGGGMRLARPAGDMVVGIVLRRTEPDLNIAPCFGSDSLRPIPAVATSRRSPGSPTR